MSVTQDYKTFTFTQNEVDALASASLAVCVQIAALAGEALVARNAARVNGLLDMGEALTAAHDKLVRK